jgi:chloramphenicol-sensitive protein RarD
VASNSAVIRDSRKGFGFLKQTDGVSSTSEMAAPTDGTRPRRVAPGYSGLLAAVVAYAIWGLFPLYFRELRGISSWEIAGIRVLATAVVTWGALAWRRDFAWIRVALVPGVMARIVLAGFAIAANWLIYVWAIVNGHVVDAAIGYYINPLITVAVGVVVLKERLTLLQKIALGFGAASVGVLSFAYGKVPWIALGLAFSFAAYGYLKKTTGLQPIQSLAAETLALTPFALVGLGLLATFDRLDVVHSPTKAQLFLLATGVITAIPLVLFGMAARKIPLAQIGLLQYIAPTMVLLCGVVVLNEHVSGERWAGVILVWVALVLLAIDALSGLSAGVAS